MKPKPSRPLPTLSRAHGHLRKAMYIVRLHERHGSPDQAAIRQLQLFLYLLKRFRRNSEHILRRLKNRQSDIV